MEDAERETNRCIEIIRNLLIFARTGGDQGGSLEPVDCCEIFDRVLRLLNYRTLGESVRVKKAYGGDVPKVPGNSNEIQQVFLNVMVNAFDAVAKSRNKEIEVGIQCSGDYVKVSVKDTGCGVPEELLSKIFDPFFTTKPVGKGTGVGLSVSLAIIRKLGGDIKCDSRPGEGTAISVYIPRTKKQDL